MIRIDNISKTFRIYRSPVDRLREIIYRKPYHKLHHALKNVTFEVGDGQTLGIVGQNGAGKSTILKILLGVLIPDEGGISVNGKITGLLELGTGFNHEMTGIQNIYMNGALIGMSKAELAAAEQDIINFTELGDFIYEPIKTYSSGMLMRLAFSIAIHATPKCFVVDEALSVGDAYFQQKCMRKIREFRDSGGSIIFVSHDMNAVKMLCDTAILLRNGTVEEYGSPEKVTNIYNKYMAKNISDTAHPDEKITYEESYGSYELKISKAELKGDDSGTSMVSSGERASIMLEIDAFSSISGVTIGFIIRDKYGQDIFGTNSELHGKTYDFEAGRKYGLRFDMTMSIGPGKYTLSLAMHIGDTHYDKCIQWQDHACSFEVAGNKGQMFIGVCKLYPEIGDIQAIADGAANL